MAACSSGTDPGETSKPLVPSWIISAGPPPRVAMTGLLASMASTMTSPKGSGEVEVWTIISMDFIKPGISRRKPKK